LFLIIDAHSKNGITVIYNGRNPDKDGEPDDRTTPNYWLDFDGKWFEIKKNKRAPWMVFTEQEYKTHKGIKEKESPLKEKIKEYFNSSYAKGATYKQMWCAAFVNWCFEQTKDYKKINTGANSLAFDWGPAGNKKAALKSSFGDGWLLGKESKPFYGAVIILSYSHVAFLVGKNSKKNKYVYIGGNQGGGSSGDQKISYGTVTIGKEYKIMKPKKYKPSKDEYKLKEYNINKDGSYETTR